MDMVAGFNMLSFDLFGLGRRALDGKTKKEEIDTTQFTPKSGAERSDADRDQEHELFFWSLYPVI